MPDMSATIEPLTILLVPEPILKARARPVATGSYNGVFALCIGLSLLGAVLILFVRRPPLLATVD